MSCHIVIQQPKILLKDRGMDDVDIDEDEIMKSGLAAEICVHATK